MFLIVVAISLSLSTKTLAFIIVYGDGSVAKPYRISTCAQLDSWINNLPGTVLFNVNFLITNNLDCTGITFDNTTSLINSTIDGGNHRITNINLGISGLVYLLDSSTIKNLWLESGNNDSAPYYYAGSFANQMTNGSELSNVKSSLKLSCSGFCGGLVGIAQDSAITKSVYDGQLNAGSYSGGLVGSDLSNKTNNLTITKSAFLGEISAPSYAGGMVGSYADNVSIVDSYVKGTFNFGSYSGGLIGAFSSGTTIFKSYTDGTAILGTFSGGLTGGMNSNITVNHAYVALVSANYSYNLGNVIGYNNSNLTLSDVRYLDDSNSGRCITSSNSSVPGCSSMTTSEMDLVPTIMGFDLTNTWQQETGKQPTLKLTNFNDPIGIPNSGDMNNDGNQDTFQGNVELLKNSSGYWTAIETKDSNSCTIGDANLLDTSGIPSYSGYEFASDFVNFNVYCPDSGQSFTTNIYLNRNIDISKAQLLFYNPTSKTYMKISGASFSHQTIGGQTFTVLSYTLTDGGPLDRDGTSNGKIVDPIVLVTPEASSGGGGNSSFGSNSRYYANYSYTTATNIQNNENALATTVSETTSNINSYPKSPISNKEKTTENTANDSSVVNVPLTVALVLTFVSVVALGFGVRKYLLKK